MPATRLTLPCLCLLTFSIFHLLFAIPATAASDLRIVKTSHYELHTDLDDELVKDLSKRMDVMYEEYEKRLSDFRPPKNAETLPVYLFAYHADYMSFTENQAANTGGIFVAGEKTFLASFLEGQGRDALRRTLQHEAFHQFVYFAISKSLPIWLNEGLAQLFEEGVWTGKSFWLGQVPPRRVRQLQADIKGHKLIDFKTFLAVTPEKWSDNLSGSAEKGATYYNQAWAMVHFLAESGNTGYREALINFLKKLHNGMDAENAFAQAFANNVQGFQDRFSEWAIALQPTSEATMIERQDTLGDLLVALHQDGQTFKDILSFRSAIVGNGYKLRYTKGNVEWTTGDSPQVYFSDLSGRLYPPRDLYMQYTANAPLPDIICRAAPAIQLRTHFYKAGDKLEHEVLIEPAADSDRTIRASQGAP